MSTKINPISYNFYTTNDSSWRGQSTPSASALPPKVFQMLLFTPTQPPQAPPRLRRSSPADDSTNIVDIIITFASSLFLATQRSRTPVDNLDAVILPAAALPAAALPAAALHAAALHAAALPASALLADDGTIIVDTS